MSGSGVSKVHETFKNAYILHKRTYRTYVQVPVYFSTYIKMPSKLWTFKWACVYCTMGTISNFYENSRRYSKEKVNRRCQRYRRRKFFHILFRFYGVAVYTHKLIFLNKMLTLRQSEADFHCRYRRHFDTRTDPDTDQRIRITDKRIQTRNQILLRILLFSSMTFKRCQQTIFLFFKVFCL